MDPIVQESDGAKSRRRGTAKGNPPVPEPKRENQVRLRDKEFETLCIYAFKTKRPRAEIVEELIRTHLKRYVVQDRGGSGVASQAGEAKDTVETLPISESVTPSGAEAPPPLAGAGEGGGEGGALPRRKRA
jgi:hypothetical protein